MKIIQHSNHYGKATSTTPTPCSLVLISTYQPVIQQCFSLTTNQHEPARNHPANRVQIALDNEAFAREETNHDNGGKASATKQ
jgi:hypothetical protein